MPHLRSNGHRNPPQQHHREILHCKNMPTNTTWAAASIRTFYERKQPDTYYPPPPNLKFSSLLYVGILLSFWERLQAFASFCIPAGKEWKYCCREVLEASWPENV